MPIGTSDGQYYENYFDQIKAPITKNPGPSAPELHIDRDHDVPLTAAALDKGDGQMYGIAVDRRVPSSHAFQGHTYDPAQFVYLHEGAEHPHMENLIAAGMGELEAYHEAHDKIATPVETAAVRAYAAKNKLDPELFHEDYKQFWRDATTQAQAQDPEHVHPHTYLKPYEPDRRNLMQKAIDAIPDSVKQGYNKVLDVLSDRGHLDNPQTIFGRMHNAIGLSPMDAGMAFRAPNPESMVTSRAWELYRERLPERSYDNQEPHGIDYRDASREKGFGDDWSPGVHPTRTWQEEAQQHRDIQQSEQRSPRGWGTVETGHSYLTDEIAEIIRRGSPEDNRFWIDQARRRYAESTPSGRTTGAGTPVAEKPKGTKFSFEGPGLKPGRSSWFDIRNEDDAIVGDAHIGLSEDGKHAHVYSLYSKSGESHIMGTRGFKSLVDKFRDEYPDIERVTATRVSGARKKADASPFLDISIPKRRTAH